LRKSSCARGSANVAYASLLALFACPAHLRG